MKNIVVMRRSFFPSFLLHCRVSSGSLIVSLLPHATPEATVDNEFHSSLLQLDDDDDIVSAKENVVKL